MLNIAVCDDDCTIVEKIKTFIQSFCLENDVNFQVQCYYDGETLLKSKKRYDLIFLDIEMPILGGIETAQRIRQIDMTVTIVYITSYPDYWKRGYKVHAFDFIEKPFMVEDIHNVLQDFLISKKDSEHKSVSLITENGSVIENMNNICYFLLMERKRVQAVTVYNKFLVKENLSDILLKLDTEQFYLTHKNCIVNLKYVQNMEKDNGIIMQDMTWLPLAQKKQKDFYVRLSKQLRKL